MPVSFDTKFIRLGYEMRINSEACRGIPTVSEPSLMNLVIKDTSRVFYLSGKVLCYKRGFR